MEELKAKADKTLQELFSSYTNQLRGALNQVFNTAPEGSELTQHQARSFRDEWLSKTEAYIKATSAMADGLGLASE